MVKKGIICNKWTLFNKKSVYTSDLTYIYISGAHKNLTGLPKIATMGVCA
jgi:hypothetical protein